MQQFRLSNIQLLKVLRNNSSAESNTAKELFIERTIYKRILELRKENKLVTAIDRKLETLIGLQLINQEKKAIDGKFIRKRRNRHRI